MPAQSPADGGLPPGSLNVLDFIQFQYPQPVAPVIPKLMRIEKFYSTLPPTTSLDAATKFPVPPTQVVDGLVALLADQSRLQQIGSIICQHVPRAGGQRFPIGLAHYWKQVIQQIDIQKRWGQAVANARGYSTTATHTQVFTDTKKILAVLPWSGRLKGLPNSINLHQLTTFLTDDWLEDDHELVMLDVLKQDLAFAGLRDNVYLENTAFTILLGAAHGNQGEYNTDRTYGWLRERGQALASGKKRYLGTIVNQDNRHWTALLVDFEARTVFFGDSNNGAIPHHLRTILDWWIRQHTHSSFLYDTLPILRQRDSFSCGMLAWSALCSKLLPGVISAPANPMVGRAEMFVRLANIHLQHMDDPDLQDMGQIDNDDQHTDSDIEEILGPQYTTGSLATPLDRDWSDDDSSNWSEADNISTRKRALSDASITNDPDAPVPKKAQVVQSSIRVGLQKPGSPKGLLRFFHQASDTERQRIQQRDTAYVAEQIDNFAERAARNRVATENRVRRLATERKRLQRARLKNLEIKGGLRSPGGQRKSTQRDMKLAHPPTLDQGGTIAELSRPASTLKKKWKEETRKPQGRKAFRPSKAVTYANWFSPFLFKQIEQARVRAGGPNWSTVAIVKDLRLHDPDTFERLSRTTMNEWIDRSGATPRWTDAAQARIQHGHILENKNAGQKGVLSNHPEVVATAKKIIIDIRAAGAVISVITARGVLLAVIIKIAPDVLTRVYADGSSFRASNSFVRKWMHDVLGYSRRQGTQAAQKLPVDWEDQCERAIIRRAYIIKEEDIIAELVVNSDQTQVLYAPGDKMTWAETGSKQVAVLGGEEKRAFTAMISVSSDGTLLPLQAIYSGKTSRSRPSLDSPHHEDLRNIGCLIQESGTATYWSNLSTMKDFVNHLLAPYFDHQKELKNLPKSQKSLWIIDVWSVHRSKEFREWMKKAHPNIVLDFVPGGCTSVAQPCDVGIQRPFKHSIKRSYQEDVVSNILLQLENQEETVTIDTRLGVLRNASTRWLWNAYQTINNRPLVKKAFERSVVRRWNLSYECMTGVEMRAHLRELKTTDPAFWKELTTAAPDAYVPPEDVPQPEDDAQDNAATETMDDDTDVPNAVLHEAMLQEDSGALSRGLYEVRESGEVQIHGDTVAERFADVDEGMETASRNVEESQMAELGRGKRRRRANRQYNQFWRHDDNCPSDDDNYSPA